VVILNDNLANAAGQNLTGAEIARPFLLASWCEPQLTNDQIGCPAQSDSSRRP
jgi:hypothetical protein